MTTDKWHWTRTNRQRTIDKKHLTKKHEIKNAREKTIDKKH